MEKSRYLKLMELGEILDSAVRLYRTNFLDLVKAQLPVTLVLLIVLPIAGGTSLFGALNQPVSYYDISLGSLLVTYLLLIIYSLIVYPLVLGAVTKVASDAALTGEPSVKEAYRFALRNKGKLIVTNFVISFIIGIVTGIFISMPLAMLVYASLTSYSGGLIATAIFASMLMAVGVFAAAYLWIRWVATFPVLVNEEEEHYGTLSAMQRSTNLVKGFAKKIFVVMVLAVLIPNVIQYSPTLVEFLLGRSLVILTIVFGVVAQGLLIPLVHCTRVVIYFELRTRKEGLDLEKRADQLTQ